MSTAAHAAAVLLGIASPQDAPPAAGTSAPATGSAANTATAPKGAGSTATTGTTATGTEEANAAPPSAAAANAWHFLVAPYLWMPGVTGTTRVKGNTVDIDITIADAVSSLGDLNFGVMGQFEATNGDLSLIFNGLYLAWGVNDTGPTLGKYHAEATQGIFELAGAWRIYGERRTIIGPAILLEVIGGARIWVLEESVRANSVGVNASENNAWVDGFGGFRGAISTGTPLVFVGRFDAGAGGSKFTWNAMVGAEWDFANWISLDAGWRWLSVDRDADGPLGATYDVTLAGPYLALVFRF